MHFVALRPRRPVVILILALILGPSVAFTQQARSTAPPAPPSAPTADPNLPDGRSLVERAIAAAGGRAAFDRIESISIYGNAVVAPTDNMSQPLKDMSFKIEFHSAPGGRFITRRIIEGLGEISDGSNGEIAWRTDPATRTYRLIEDEELEQALGQANVQKVLLRALEHFDDFDTLEQVHREGAATHHVRMTSDEHEQHMYFGVEDGLLRSTDIITATGPLTMSVGEYKPFEGALLFTTLKISQGGMTIIMTFDAIVLNKTPDGVFEPPAEVKRLAAEKKAAETTPPG